MSDEAKTAERFVRAPADWPKRGGFGECLSGGCRASVVDGSPWCARHTYLVGANDAMTAVDLGASPSEVAKRIGEL